MRSRHTASVTGNPHSAVAGGGSRNGREREGGGSSGRGEIGNWEDNWDPHEYNEEGGEIKEGIQERGDTASGFQGELPHIDMYSQGMRAEQTEQQPAGWWSYEDYYRQVSFLQDRIQGTEEQLGLKKAMLRDYRERCQQLEDALDALRREKLNRDNVAVTTGINTSIFPDDTISAVQSSITTASETWLDHITKVCLKHTHELLEQRREHDISQQKSQAFLMDNNKALAAVVETTLEQVGGY